MIPSTKTTAREILLSGLVFIENEAYLYIGP